MEPSKTSSLNEIVCMNSPLSYLSNWIMHFFVWATQWIGTLVQMVM